MHAGGWSVECMRGVGVLSACRVLECRAHAGGRSVDLLYGVVVESACRVWSAEGSNTLCCVDESCVQLACHKNRGFLRTNTHNILRGRFSNDSKIHAFFLIRKWFIRKLY